MWNSIVVWKRGVESSQVEEEPLLTSDSLPMILVIMPCHKEPTDVLLDSVNFLLKSDYPSHLLHLFLSFDGYENKETFLAAITFFGAIVSEESTTTAEGYASGIRITISIFDHGGKTRCQGNTFSYIQHNYKAYFIGTDNTFALLLDSDTRLGKRSLRSLAQTTVSVYFVISWV